MSKFYSEDVQQIIKFMGKISQEVGQIEYHLCESAEQLRRIANALHGKPDTHGAEDSVVRLTKSSASIHAVLPKRPVEKDE